MYQWQNQQVLPFVPGSRWRWQEKLLCSVVWHYHQSYVQNYMVNLMLVQCVIASHAEVWTFQFWWKFYQELSVTMLRVPVGTAVSPQGQHYGQYKGHADQRRSFKLSSGWLHFEFLTSQASKLYYLVAFHGVVEDRFSTKSESMKSATAFLAMSSASIRSLAMPGLAGTPKDKK